MHHRKHRVTPLQKVLVEGRVNPFVTGEEPAAHHEDDATTIRLLRLKNIERQRSPKFTGINDILSAGECRGFAMCCWCGVKRQRTEEHGGKRFATAYPYQEKGELVHRLCIDEYRKAVGKATESWDEW